MSAKTSIEWTDITWNPVSGCDKVSPGCDNCYAETIATRFRGGKAYPNGFKVTLKPERLADPLRKRSWRGKRVFVNSMSDLFHGDVPDEYIAQVFAVMAMAPDVTFQLLTKRHGRMRSLLNDQDFVRAVGEQMVHLERDLAIIPGGFTWPLPNLWLGVSVEDQRRANLRVPALLDTPAAVRWLSCEPLLGRINLGPWPHLMESEDGYAPIDWVVVGGESGPGARPMHPDWARSLRDQCVAARVPFFFKQWGNGSLWTDRHGDRWALRDDGLMESPETAYFPRSEVERRWGPLRPVGKKAAGRELDGRTWDEYPSRAGNGGAS